MRSSKKWCRTTVAAAGMALARAEGMSQLPLTSAAISFMYVCGSGVFLVGRPVCRL